MGENPLKKGMQYLRAGSDEFRAQYSAAASRTLHLTGISGPGNILLLMAGVLGALLLGAGMCLTMVFGKMDLGIVIGLVGIVVLLMLLPLTKGIHD